MVLEPIGGEITIACESGLVDAFPKTSVEKALAEQLRNSKFSETGQKSNKQGCYYTSIPRVVKRKGIPGQDLTSLNLDKTQLLETILLKDFGGLEDLLLGELQFSFIAFLMGQSLEAFLQWKDLVTLLFSCTEADFCSLVQEASVVDGDLLSWTRKLEQLLQTTLGWDFQQNSATDGLYDEFAPVVEILDDTSLNESPAT